MGRGSRWDIVTCMLLHVGLFIVAGESPSSTTPRNLVLGTQNGLLVQEIRVFLASLRSTGCRAEVVIFSAESGREDLLEVATTFDAQMLPYDASALSASHGPANLHRFTLFRRYLEDAGLDDPPFSQVLLCDIRDVFFQQDPFAALAVQSGIGVAIEPVHLPIGQCDVHLRWLSAECPAYAREGMGALLADRPRSCAGTTIGTRGGIHTYCAAMEAEAVRTVTAVGEEQGRAVLGRATTFDGSDYKLWCNDQAMHNVLLWTGQLNASMAVREYRAEESLLATVGTMREIRISEQGEVLVGCAGAAVKGGSAELGTCAGGGEEQAVALVHQYDRVEALVRAAQGLYGLPGEEFLTFQQKYFPDNTGLDGDGAAEA